MAIIVDGWTPEDIVVLAGSLDYQPNDNKAPCCIDLTDEQADGIARQANEIDASEDAVKDMILDIYSAWIDRQNYLRR